MVVQLLQNRGGHNSLPACTLPCLQTHVCSLESACLSYAETIVFLLFLTIWIHLILNCWKGSWLIAYVQRAGIYFLSLLWNDLKLQFSLTLKTIKGQFHGTSVMLIDCSVLRSSAETNVLYRWWLTDNSSQNLQVLITCFSNLRINNSMPCSFPNAPKNVIH